MPKSIYSSIGFSETNIDNFQLIIYIRGNNTVIATKNNITKTAIGTKDVFGFTNLEAGEWLITATNNNISSSKSVIISDTDETIIIEMAFNTIPEFTYTGDYEIVDDADNPISEGNNWKIRFLTSGILDISKYNSVHSFDIFIVSGGGGSTRYLSGVHSAASGGPGYNSILSNINILTGIYEIVIGDGGKGSDDYGGKGGTTSGFGYSIDGGNGATYNNPGIGGDSIREFNEDSYSRIYCQVSSVGVNGSPNTGDGGGTHASYATKSVNGGSGIIIIRNTRATA